MFTIFGEEWSMILLNWFMILESLTLSYQCSDICCLNSLALWSSRVPANCGCGFAIEACQGEWWGPNDISFSKKHGITTHWWEAFNSKYRVPVVFSNFLVESVSVLIYFKIGILLFIPVASFVLSVIYCPYSLWHKPNRGTFQEIVCHYHKNEIICTVCLCHLFK